MMRAAKTRQCSAVSLVEATFGVVVIVAVTIVLIDLAMLLFAVSLNDSICRDAARKAATGDPASAEQRAQSVVDQARQNGKATSINLVSPVVTDIISQPRLRRDPETDELINPGGLVTGSVNLSTEIKFTPLVLHLFIVQKPPLTFRSTQSSPICYVVPPK